MATLLDKKSDEKLFNGLIITLGASMLFPEYIAPFFVFGLYIHFLKQFKLTDRKAKMGEIGKVFFTYTIFMLASAIWSDTKLMSALIALLWMGCMLGYILVANIITDDEKLKNAITAVNVSAGIIGLISILEYATFNMTIRIDGFNYLFPNPFYYKINDKVFELIPIDIINYIFASRSSATFDNPLILSTYLVLVTPFCAYGSVYFKRSKHRKISRLCLVLAIGGIIGTQARAGFLAIAAAIIIMLLGSKRIFKKLWPILIAVFIGVPIGLATRYDFLSGSDFANSNSQRINIWKSCIDMFRQNPILGLGAGTENIHQRLINDYGIERTHAHNLFLEMLVEGGIIGAGFVLIIIALIVKAIIKIAILKDTKYRSYGILYVASLMAFFIVSMTEFTLQSPKELMILFFVLGFIEATARLAGNTAQPIEATFKNEEGEEEIKEAVEVE